MQQVKGARLVIADDRDDVGGVDAESATVALSAGPNGSAKCALPSATLSTSSTLRLAS
jgi:hypothetical protein